MSRLLEVDPDTIPRLAAPYRRGESPLNRQSAVSAVKRVASSITEAEAKAAIVANGYLVRQERPTIVIVEERRGRAASRWRKWTGVNFRDLAQAFNLHERKAGQ